MKRISNTSPKYGVVGALFGEQLRFETTGKHHQFEPGAFAKTTRAFFKALTPEAYKKRAARRLQAGLEQVERMEKESAWLKRHGSPQRVLDLPDHATYFEIKARYQDLIVDTHPDTARQTSDHDADVEENIRKQISSSQATTGKALVNAKAIPQAPPSFELVREAHAILMDPNSLYYQNASNGQLLKEVQFFTGKKNKGSATIVNSVDKFMIFSLLIGAVVTVFICTLVFKKLNEGILQAIDPEFFKRMVEKERQEAERRAAGEEVNVDPERLAPDEILKQKRPGLFLHGHPSEVYGPNWREELIKNGEMTEEKWVKPY